MAAIPPPHPWLPSSSNSSSSSAHFVAVAAAERLGHLLHKRCSASLRILLSSPSRGVYHIDSLPRIKDIWCTRPYLSKRYSFLETLANALSTSCSCLSLFSGKETEKGNDDKRKLQFEMSKGNPSNERPWTNVLLALYVLVHVGQIATQGRLLLWGAKVNTLIGKGQLWRLVTSSFLHANILHLMVNCYSLNSIGAAVEQLTGPKRFLTIYFTSALASSMMSYRFCRSPSVGASGAIFGLVGSLAIFILRNRTLVEGGKQELQHIANVLGLNMVLGLLFSGIDNWGHFGGLLGGAATSWFLGPVWRYESLSEDGKVVFADKAPIFRLFKKRLS